MPGCSRAVAPCHATGIDRYLKAVEGDGNILEEISAVKDSMADIITGFTHAVADLQKKDIGARVHPDTLKALNEICTNFVVEVGKQLMAHRDRQLELQKKHEERIARMLKRNKGVWVSDGWMKILIVWHLSLHPNGVVLPMNDN